MRRKKLSACFYVDEFMCGCCGEVGNKKNLQQLVTRLEMLRTKFARPIHIVGGYRCDKGKNNSHHICKGADIRVDGVSEGRLAKAAKAFFKNVRVGPGYVHVDFMTRKDKPTEETSDASNKTDPKPSVKRKVRRKPAAKSAAKPKTTSRKRPSKKEEGQKGE